MKVLKSYESVFHCTRGSRRCKYEVQAASRAFQPTDVAGPDGLLCLLLAGTSPGFKSPAEDPPLLMQLVVGGWDL